MNKNANPDDNDFIYISDDSSSSTDNNESSSSSSSDTWDYEWNDFNDLNELVNPDNIIPPPINPIAPPVNLSKSTLKRNRDPEQDTDLAPLKYKRIGDNSMAPIVHVPVKPLTPIKINHK